MSIRTFSRIEMLRFAKDFQEKPENVNALKFLKGWCNANPPKSPEDIARNIVAAIEEYEKSVLAMTDKELIEHVFEDYDHDDFATQELIKRQLNPKSIKSSK